MIHWFLYVLIGSAFILNGAFATAQTTHYEKKQKEEKIIPAAALMNDYLPMLEGKKVALLINQTATVGERLLLDTLLSRKVNVVKVFVPEHGFRGTADAGAHVKNAIDDKTGLPIISLYGDNKKPKKEQLKDVDVVVYDLQDVGVRFYTYISSLEYMMEACADAGKQLIVLDRPNPNGHYVDGPVLEKQHKSFVGMQRIPVVYGMTVGEYANMLVGEEWIANAKKLDLKVVPCKGYDHNKRYNLPVPPSPNLKTMASIYLYPALCFFEGTVVSVGRGTDKPFQQWGHPDFKGKSEYSFIPNSTTGASKPMYEGKTSYGKLVATDASKAFEIVDGKLKLDAIVEAYKWYPDKTKFFNNFFEKLAGTNKLREMIEKGMSAEDIRATWQPDVAAFKQIRKKYLLYKDFER
ncbi:MAG TPA: DUF1343 domain-containing protein [Flavipsychrobacter sp.]|nr:DUF1343 domain-containing protein [Flavipsychrobacter sp.]